MFPLSSAVTVAPLAMLAVGTVKLPTKMVSTVAALVNPLPLMVMVCRGTAVEGDSVIGAPIISMLLFRVSAATTFTRWVPREVVVGTVTKRFKVPVDGTVTAEGRVPPDPPKVMDVTSPAAN